MRKNKKLKKYIFFFLSLLLVIFVGKIVLDFVKISPFLFELIFKREIKLKTADHNVNVLLLGIGGKNHEGPNLSDTIIFASISISQNKVTLVSIPRDLWIPDLDAKINTAYSTGEDKREGGGLVLAKAVVSKILKQPVDYGVRIDFDGFVKAVDELGGLNIEVERAFDDFEYPIEGKEEDPCGHSEEELVTLATASSQLEAFPCRYMTIHFNKGLQEMDGGTSLMFARSRHAKGEEGSDFARSKRQEKIIKAFKDKIFSLDTVFNPARIINLYNIIGESIDTDIKQSEFDDFIRLVQKLKNAKIENIILDVGDRKTKRPGFLVNPLISGEYNYSWVLIPRIGNGNFTEIQKYTDCVIKLESCKFPEVSN
ncbi:MAG: LCP family protein [Candidatus Levybacteria bacterium]|nr:LCP family protein [Candidatus Levybacteria bacterium]